MGSATNLQTSFVGGALAPSMQGRAEHPKYKTGMSVCHNAMPLETGAWQRRPGTRSLALTRAGAKAVLFAFDFSQNAPFVLELTDSHARFFNGHSLVHTNDAKIVQSISTATPAVVTFLGTGVFSDGDSVEFLRDTTLSPDIASPLRGRQFLLGNSSGATTSLYDPVSGAAIDGSTLNYSAIPMTMNRVFDLSTPYTRPLLDTVRGVQALNGTSNVFVLLSNKVTPYALIAATPICRDEFDTLPTLTAASFVDGPYLDPETDGTTITPSAVSGTVTLTASNPKFAATDVGRHIRLLSEPAQWASGTSYVTGNLVTYLDAYYVALQNSTGKTPGADAVNWGVASNASAWVWGIITVFTSSTVVTAVLQVVNTLTTKLPGVLVNTNAMKTWRFGLFNQVTGYPSAGAYHEGRLWLTGVLGNRVDGSKPNDIFNFSPTAADGTVSDANAIAYTFNSSDINSIFWLAPQESGILCGTQAGEWLIRSSTVSDPLTPTNIQAHRMTRYGSENIDNVNAPFATMFVARNNKKMYEYLSDAYTGKYSGTNISLSGSHFCAPGIAEIKYQKEIVPTLWARIADGTLAGMTYRRDSAMLSQEAAFSGWHNHALGTSRTVKSITVGPSVGGDLDALSMVTLDPITGLYWVEVLEDAYPDNGTSLDAWHLDGATTPSGAYISGSNLIMYGLHYIEGQTVSAYVAGIDAGDYTVSNSTITIPLPAANGLLTTAFLQSVNDPVKYGERGMTITFNSSFVITANSLQSYIGPTTPVTGVSGFNFLYDPVKQRVFEFSEGSSSTAGIRVFDLISGLQTNQATHDQIYGAGSTSFVIGPNAIDYAGNIYMVESASNSAQIIKLDPDDFVIRARICKKDSNFLLDQFHVPYPTTMAPVRTCGESFLVCGALTTVTKIIYVLNITDSGECFAGHSFAIGEKNAYTTPTFDGAGFAFAVGVPDTTFPTTTALGIYRTDIAAGAGGYNSANYSSGGTQNPFITTTKIGTVTPAQVDATWTHYTDMSGIAYDQTDGNLIMQVETTDSVTNKVYVIKINSKTAAVMWTIPVASGLSNKKNDMVHTVIGYNNYGFLSSGGILYKIDTIAGTETHASVPGLTASAAIYDYRVGSVFTFSGFSQTGGSPTLLNATPTSWSGQWARLYCFPSYVTGRQYITVPSVVGKTFTSQGQRLRPIEPADSGARLGPALGKTRRNHRSAFLFLNTAAIYLGTTFNNVRKAIFKSLGGTAYADNQLFSGVHSVTVEDNNSYDGQICWQVTRPYPATVLSNEGFLETQDR